MGEEEDKKKQEEEEAAKKAAEEEAKKKKNNSSPIEDARKINEEKSKLLDREEALQKRKETFEAEKMVGGGTQSGQADEGKKEETNHEYRERIEKAMAGGKTEFGD